MIGIARHDLPLRWFAHSRLGRSRRGLLWPRRQQDVAHRGSGHEDPQRPQRHRHPVPAPARILREDLPNQMHQFDRSPARTLPLLLFLEQFALLRRVKPAVEGRDGHAEVLLNPRPRNPKVLQVPQNSEPLKRGIVLLCRYLPHSGLEQAVLGAQLVVLVLQVQHPRPQPGFLARVAERLL